jgi:predicted Zn finger-like uncharacterized protein
MIAGCPKCGARYRVEREKLTPSGVRLRCVKCESVFRVRPPDADAPAAERADSAAAPASPPPRSASAPAASPSPRSASAPAASPPESDAARAPIARPAARPLPAPGAAAPNAEGDLVLIAIPEADVAKSVSDALCARGARTVVVHDGVDAVLELQRRLPKAAVIAAHLPKMFGFQICELVKRNESLRKTWLVLAGAIHHPERYRRPASDTYGADAYLELPDLPDGVLPLLQQGGVVLGEAPPPREPAPSPAPAPAARSLPRREALAPAPSPAPPARPVEAAPARARAGDGLDDQRAKAERLARIIVSDIVLYNEQKFGAAIRDGNVVEALDADLAEGRHLFQERIDARVRGERDYLAEELLRVARQRGAK